MQDFKFIFLLFNISPIPLMSWAGVTLRVEKKTFEKITKKYDIHINPTSSHFCIKIYIGSWPSFLLHEERQCCCLLRLSEKPACTISSTES